MGHVEGGSVSFISSFTERNRVILTNSSVECAGDAHTRGFFLAGERGEATFLETGIGLEATVSSSESLEIIIGSVADVVLE